MADISNTATGICKEIIYPIQQGYEGKNLTTNR
jgi:hypothetical protein